MLARFSFVLVAMALLAGQAAAQNANIAGEWSMVVESDQGPMEIGLTLSFDRQGYLTVKIDGPQGEMAITGETAGEEIYFGFTINANGQEIAISFEGYWTEAEMEGVVYFGEFGSGDWYASRK